MKQFISKLAVASSMFALTAMPAFAATYSLEPWTYDPDSTGTVVAELSASGELTLEKNAPTPTNSAAGAEIAGVEGLSTTGMTLSYDVEGYCGAGAPRFNVYLEGGTTVFLGCAHGNDGSGHVTFEAGQTYGGVLFPEGETILGIDIVMDEEGQSTLSNIQVDGQDVVVIALPSDKEACKQGGWMELTDADGNSFKNQGQCVSYMAKMQHD
jgi:hypothetical protein